MPEAALTPMPPNVSFERAATLGSLVTLASDKKMGMLMWRVNPSRDMAYLAEQLESGAIEPLIGRTYPLAETPDAMRYLETGEARGKIVITT